MACGSGVHPGTEHFLFVPAVFMLSKWLSVRNVLVCQVRHAALFTSNRLPIYSIVKSLVLSLEVSNITLCKVPLNNSDAFSSCFLASLKNILSKLRPHSGSVEAWGCAGLATNWQKPCLSNA